MKQDGKDLRRAGWCAVAGAALLAFGLCSCATFDAVLNTPVDVWVHLERIVIAVAKDFLTLFAWML